MNRFFTAALIAGLFSTTGLVGCGEKAEVTQKETVTGPGGTTETTTTRRSSRPARTPRPTAPARLSSPPSESSGDSTPPGLVPGGVSGFFLVDKRFS